MSKPSRAELKESAVMALRAAEEALQALADSYPLKEGEKASSCHPMTGTLNTKSQVEKLRRAVMRQKA